MTGCLSDVFSCFKREKWPLSGRSKLFPRGLSSRDITHEDSSDKMIEFAISASSCTAHVSEYYYYSAVSRMCLLFLVVPLLCMSRGEFKSAPGI